MEYLRPICHKISQLPYIQDFQGQPIFPLAGMKDVGFGQLEQLTLENGTVTSLVRSIKEGQDKPLSSFENLCTVRAPIAGLAMDRPHIMGIVNVTPDSFSDGGKFINPDQAVIHGMDLVEQGASILDIGGESTRPGAGEVPIDQELKRVIPVIKALREKSDVVISIDTRKAEVMKQAVLAGASMINDVSALSYDQEALSTAADLKVPVVLMHAQGTPQSMQDDPHYDHCLLEVYDYLNGRIEKAIKAGISKDLMVVDPGIGFGKTLAHNLELLAGMSLFHGLGVPIMLGASRKRFIAALSQNEPVEERLPGSLAAALKGVAQGTQLLRVHDVSATAQALAIWAE